MHFRSLIGKSVWFFLMIWFASFSLVAESSEIINLTDKKSHDVKFEIIKDTSGKLAFPDIIDSDDFKKSNMMNYGFCSTVVWIRFSIRVPEKNETNWFLEIGYPLLDVIDVYIPEENGRYTLKRYGDTIPFNKREIDHHNFLIPLKYKHGIYTYHLRVKTESSLTIPLKILSNEEVISKINIEKTAFGLLYGALIIMIIYNLLLSISMRNITYFLYSVFIITLVFASLALNGYGFQYLWRDTLWMNNSVPLSMFLSILGIVSFSRSFLESRRHYPFIDKISFVFLFLIMMGAVLSVFIPYKYAIRVGAAAYLPGIVVVSFIVLKGIKNKNRQAYFYAIAFVSLFVGVFATVMHRFGVFANSSFTLWGFQIGGIISVALFSLGLADKVNVLTTNLAEMNAGLEQKVKNRTVELEAAMEEVESTNDNLKSLNHDLEKSHMVHFRDMAMASNVQSSFLPKEAPLSDDYEIAFYFRPFSGVSGDFYDFYEADQRLIGTGIFDVSGHGISSGLLTLMARSIINRTFTKFYDETLGRIAQRINRRLISEINCVDNYLTGIFLKFRQGFIDYVNCGHPDMICKKGSTGRVRIVLDQNSESISGPFLGIDIMNKSFQTYSLRPEKGDCFLLYTDCFNESHTLDGKIHDEKMIIKSFQSAPEGSAEDILQHLVDKFWGYVGNAENLSDDLTVMLLKVK